MPVDPSFLPIGPEWQIPSVDGGAMPGVDEVQPQGDSFGSMLGKQIQGLSELQTEAAEGSAALAAGTAEDPAAVVMAVERARLSMQLASQLRTKGVEALNDIFHTQV